MERELWEKIIGFVAVEKYPTLPCPYCKTLSLHIDKSSLSYRKANCSSTKALIYNAESQKAQQVVNALIKHAHKLPQELYQSLTLGRGKEMAAHRRVTLATWF